MKQVRSVVALIENLSSRFSKYFNFKKIFVVVSELRSQHIGEIYFQLIKSEIVRSFIWAKPFSLDFSVWYIRNPDNL